MGVESWEELMWELVGACGSLWGGVVNCDGMVGSAGLANLVVETCLSTGDMQGLSGSGLIVYGHAMYSPALQCKSWGL